MNAQEQTPVLCSECLGPAQPQPDGSVVCGYCGHRGVLPHEQLQRAMELSRRVRQAATSVAQVQGVESALAHVFESRWAFLRAAGLFGFFALALAVHAVISGYDAISQAPSEVRATLIVNYAMGPVAIGGFALAICFALALARRSYRRAVRPLLFARAPRETGLPARCRACGGPLPDRRDAYVSCVYCSTQNLVTEELGKNRAELLQREQRFYMDRGHRVLAATTRRLPNTQRIFVLACVGVYGLLLGLGYLAQALLPG